MADGFTIKIEGVKELQNTFKLLSKDIEDIITDGVREGGGVVEITSKVKVHVVTGRLQRSLRELHVIKTKNKTEVQVGSDVPYAAAEEFRDDYRGSHSYLRYALDNNETAIVNAIENKIHSRLSRYNK